MKIFPLIGLGDLRFGDSSAAVSGAFDAPSKRRLHCEASCRCTLDYPGFTFGFDAQDRLQFIAVTEGVEIDLWGVNPFDIFRSSSALSDAPVEWLQRLGFRTHVHGDCFGAYVSVCAEGITFCFSVESGGLEGIQLYPGDLSHELLP